MNALTVDIYYRTSEAEGPTVYHCSQVDDTNLAVLILTTELTSYGQKTVTRIPWDRIERVESRMQ